MEEAQNPPGASHRVTSELLKKKNPITVGRAQRDKAHITGWPVQVLYRIGMLTVNRLTGVAVLKARPVFKLPVWLTVP